MPAWVATKEPAPRTGKHLLVKPSFTSIIYIASRFTWRKIKIMPKTWYKKPLFAPSLLTTSLIPEPI